MADGTLKVGTITTSSGSGNIAIGSGVTLLSNVPAFEAYLSSTQNISDASDTKVQFDTEVLDTDNCYDNATNYRFTPTVAGKYFVYTNLTLGSDTDTTVHSSLLKIFKNGSVYSDVANQWSANYIRRAGCFKSVIIDMNGSSDYLEIYAYINVTGGAQAQLLATTSKANTFGAYRLGVE